MKSRICLLGLLALSLWELGEAAFNCRRTGMTCANSGVCTTEGKCQCAEGFSGFDCSLQNSSIAADCTVTCENGGTCYGDTKDKCYCSEAYYGNTCEYLRVGVTCQHDKMEINIFPHGDFAGAIFILGQNRSTCNLSLISSQPDVTYEGGALQGFGIQLNHVDADCGNASLVETDRTRNYSRDVVLEYNTDYVTSLDELVTLTCSEGGKTGEDGVIFTSSTKTVQLNESTMYEKSNVDNAYEPLNFKVKDKNNATVTSQSEPLSVGDDVTFDFELSSTDKYKRLYVINCTVMDRETDPQKYLVLIENGCPTDSARAVYRSMTRAKNETGLLITMAVFKFSSGNQLVVACFLKLCVEGDSSCDAKDCGVAGTQGLGRKKRDTVEPNEMRLTRTLAVRDPPGSDQACEGGCLNDGICVNVGGQDKCFCTDNYYGPTCALIHDSSCATPDVFIIVLGVTGSLLLLLLVISLVFMGRTLRRRHKALELGQPFSQPEPVRFTLPRVQCAHL